jgi:hypothetical protein
MKKQDEMFPPTTLDKLASIRADLIKASEKADEAVERAEAKAYEAHTKVYQINEVIEAVKNGADANTAEVD